MDWAICLHSQMIMKIENRCQKQWPSLQPEKRINRFLESVPQEHLIGLSKIVILDEAVSTTLKNKEIRGRYIYRRGKEPAYVEID